MKNKTYDQLIKAVKAKAKAVTKKKEKQRKVVKERQPTISKRQKEMLQRQRYPHLNAFDKAVEMLRRRFGQ